MKGVSPIVSALLLIVISISIASVVAPWMYELVLTSANSTSSDTAQQIRCRNAGLDFDSAYGNYGAVWNFTGNGTDYIYAKVVNTGTSDLWQLSIEAELESGSGKTIAHYALTDETAIGFTDPLKPSYSAIISANITSDVNGTAYGLSGLRVLNAACPNVAPSLPL